MTTTNPITDELATAVSGRLGDFRIVREVGRGGMGVVYEAVQESLARKVALKVMAAGSTPDGTFAARFEREAKAAGRLHHTHIVPIYDVGVVGRLHYIALQLVDGEGLDRMTARLRAAASTPKGSTDSAEDAQVAVVPRAGTAAYWNWVALLLADAADAVEYAHRHGIVHRDIKPANLLLDRAGSIWITDFGLAHCAEADDLTAPGDILGTTRYMAPERFEGVADHRSDIYALGATLYELLTLRPAFDQTDRLELINRIRNAAPPPPSSLVHGLPRDLETIVLKALAREPSRRYATGGELADDLRRFAAGEPIAARRASLPERMMRWSARHPVEAGLSLATLLALAGGTVVSAGMYARSENNRKDAVANLKAAEQATQLAAERLAEVERQRGKAEGNLKQALAAVDEYLITTSNSKLLQVAGLQPLRRELLESAAKFYRGFLARQQNSPLLATEVANAHVRLGMIVDSTGRSEDGLAEHQKAIALLRPLLATEWTPKRANLLGTALNQVGLLLAKSGKFQQGKPMLDESIAVFEEIVRRDPTDDPVAHNIAKSHTNFCVALWQNRERVEAAEHSHKALEILKRLAAKYPQNEEYVRSIGNNYQNLSILASAGGEHRQAGVYAKRAFEQFEAVGKMNPKDLRARYSSAKMLFRLADLSALYAPPKETLATLEKSTAIYKQLVDENPTVADFRVGKMECLATIALIQAMIGRPEAALAPVREAVALAREAAQRDPKNHSIQGQALRIDMSHAQILIALRRHSEALLVLDEAGAAIAALGKSFAPESEIFAMLAQADAMRAEIRHLQEGDDEARRLLESALERIQKALSATKGHAALYSALCDAWLLRARIDRKAGRGVDASAALEKAERAAGTNAKDLVAVAKQSALLARAKALKPEPSPAEREKLRAAAVRLVEKAVKEKLRVPELLNDPAFSEVRNRPQFEAATQKMAAAERPTP